MKKFLTVLLAFFIVFSVTACSNEEENKPLTIEWGKENKFDGLVSYEIESIGKPKQITPDTVGAVYTYYKPQKDSNILLDVVVIMKNLKDSDLSIKKDLSAMFVIGEDNYAASIATVSDDGTSLKQDGTIVSKAINKVHFYAEVSPKKLNNKIEFKLTTKDKEKPKEAIMKFNMADIAKNYETKNINDVITIKNRAELTLQTTNVTKELIPANPEGLYTYYKVNADTNSFVVLTTAAKNISAGDLMASNLVVAKLLDKDGNEYPANIFYENEARNDLATGSTTNLGAGQGAMVHFAFEVPDDVVSGEKKIRISFQGEAFLVNI